MEPGTTIKQKKFGVQLLFHFGDDKLTRTLSDYSGENQFSVFYDAIDIDDISLLTVNKSQRFLRFLIIITIGLSFILASTKGNHLVADVCGVLIVGSFLALIIAHCLKLLTIKYTMLRIPNRTGTNTIQIIHDKNHDLILQEIKTRRIARMRKLYAGINFANDPNKEMQKFLWLRNNAIINELEYREAMEKLKAAQSLTLKQEPSITEDNKDYLN